MDKRTFSDTELRIEACKLEHSRQFGVAKQPLSPRQFVANAEIIYEFLAAGQTKIEGDVGLPFPEDH